MEWISCKTRLPEFFDREEECAPYYIAYLEGYGATLARFMDGRWCRDYTSVIDVPVTHWMPLPAAPATNNEKG